ncbi:hypothetical protein HMPREF3232_01092 [Fannyhessea vaginae]|nr:hypothetical protein HMPREF3232_01092 [Fannyhessea vaginae]
MSATDTLSYMRDIAFNMIAMEINISNSYHVTKDTIIYSNNHK